MDQSADSLIYGHIIQTKDKVCTSKRPKWKEGRVELTYCNYRPAPFGLRTHRRNFVWAEYGVNSCDLTLDNFARYSSLHHLHILIVRPFDHYTLFFLSSCVVCLSCTAFHLIQLAIVYSTLHWNPVNWYLSGSRLAILLPPPVTLSCAFYID